MAGVIARYLLAPALTLLGSACGVDAGRFAPLAEAEFFFHLAGESREFIVRPRFYSATEVALLSADDDLPRVVFEKGPPRWRIKAEAFRSGRLVQAMYLKPKASWPRSGDREHYRTVSLGSSEQVDFEFFPKPINIRLTVEDIDDRYSSARPGIRVAVRTSPIP